MEYSLVTPSMVTAIEPGVVSEITITLGSSVPPINNADVDTVPVSSSTTESVIVYAQPTSRSKMKLEVNPGRNSVGDGSLTAVTAAHAVEAGTALHEYRNSSATP